MKKKLMVAAAVFAVLGLVACSVSPKVTQVIQKAYTVTVEAEKVASEIAGAADIDPLIKEKAQQLADAAANLKSGLQVVAIVLGIDLSAGTRAVGSPETVTVRDPGSLQDAVSELKTAVEQAK